MDPFKEILLLEHGGKDMQASTIKNLKLVVAGEGGVGKTALIETFGSGFFKDGTIMTIAVQFHVKKLILMDEEIYLQIWDLGGQKQFYDMGVFERYCHGAHGAMICFDLSDPDTLEEVPKWTKILPPSIPKILVGTKKDLVKGDSLIDYIERYLEDLNFVTYIETSSKSDPASVQLVFDELLSFFSCNRQEKRFHNPGNKISILS